MKLLATATVSLLIATFSTAATLTLRDAAAEALSRNPQVTAAKSEADAAYARLNEARAAWLPVVDATANSTRSNNPVFVFGSLLEQGRFGPQNFDTNFLNNPPVVRNDRLAINVRYAFFDQMRRFDRTAQAKHGVIRANSAAEETRQRILSDVIARYYGLTLARQRRIVASQAVRAAEAAAKVSRDKAAQGLTVDSDRLAAEVHLAQFRQQEIEAAGDAEIARAALAMTLERPLAEPIDIDPALPERTFPQIDLAAATQNALQTRGELASAHAARAAAELQLRSARATLLPRLDGFASWGASGSTFSNRNSDHTMGLIASIDVFDGGKFARIAEARAGADGSKAMEAITRDRIEMETVSAWYRVNAARQQLEVASSAAEQAAAAARIVEDRYENGLTTITEELRSQTALVGARLALLAARHQYITGYAELLRSTGGLHDIDPFL
ncbi:MAG TPA: TolC family protein [Thermoanaerobaculia bacterium]